MNKKTFYITALLVIIIFIFGYLSIFLFSGLGLNNEKLGEKEISLKEPISFKEEDVNTAPQIKVISGEVISNENNVIEIEVFVKDGQTKKVKLKSTENITKINGSYRDGKLAEEKSEEINISNIKIGDIISAIVKNTVVAERMEEGILEVEMLSVNLPGNSEIK